MGEVAELWAQIWRALHQTPGTQYDAGKNGPLIPIEGQRKIVRDMPVSREEPSPE